MSDLKTNSSYAVQPEIVLTNGLPTQTRVTGYSLSLKAQHSTRVQHDQFPISVQQSTPTQIRVCTGIPVINSPATVAATERRSDETIPNKIEWSWLPEEQWQIALHRYGIGLSTSRGLYTDKKNNLHLYLKLPNHWPVYGLGEKTGELNKQGKRWTFWNSDVFAPHTESVDELYQSIPFMLTSTDQGWMGVMLDNPGRSTIDLSLDNEVCISVETGAIDLYVFYGDTYADVLEQYTQLTGRPFLPPRWAMGYHQSRHSYQSQAEVREIVDNFKKYNFPLDALYLDIMYMDEYRVFSFNTEHYDRAPELVDDLYNQGVRVVPIVDPGVKLDSDYRVFQEGIANSHFVTKPNGDIWTGQVWPGESAWPDFFQIKTQQWWKDLHRYYTDMGVQGIWNDMNEPAVFNDSKTIDLDAEHMVEGQPVQHKAVHNAYGLLMSEATAAAIVDQSKQRPFVLTRAGYLGIQRCAAVWTGDNRSSWEHLRMSVPMLLNLGMSGVSFSGADIGGFMDDARPELFTRWMQLGCFYPFMRNHCSLGLARQEPWSFGEPWTDKIRSAMHRRYKILPYIYQLMRDAHETGLPPMRPMLWAEGINPQTENLSDQFMMGESLIVAPILEAGKLARSVWLPSGQWHCVQTGKLYTGKQYVISETGLEDIPMFLKAGSILPLSAYRSNTQSKQKELRLLIVEGEQHGRLLFRDDDGITADPNDNKYARLSFGYHQTSDSIECHLSIDISHFKPEWRHITLGLPAHWKTKKVKINGNDLSGRTKVDGFGCKIIFCQPSQWL